MPRLNTRWLALCALVTILLTVLAGPSHAGPSDLAVRAVMVSSTAWPELDDHNPCTRDYANLQGEQHDTPAGRTMTTRLNAAARSIEVATPDVLSAHAAYYDDGRLYKTWLGDAGIILAESGSWEVVVANESDRAQVALTAKETLGLSSQAALQFGRAVPGTVWEGTECEAAWFQRHLKRRGITASTRTVRVQRAT